MLTLSARYGLDDLQEELLEYTVRTWRRICHQHKQTVDVLKEFPEIPLRISLRIALRA